MTLTESGGDAFMPIRLLPHDYYAYDSKRQVLIGRRTKRTFQLGEILKVRLLEANPLTGNLIVSLESAPRSYKKRTGKGTGTRTETGARKGKPSQKIRRKKDPTEQKKSQKSIKK